MHRAKRFILPAVAICVLLATAVFTYEAWAAPRQSVFPYTNVLPVQKQEMPLVAEEPAPSTPAPTKRVQLPSRSGGLENKAA